MGIAQQPSYVSITAVLFVPLSFFTAAFASAALTTIEPNAIGIETPYVVGTTMDLAEGGVILAPQSSHPGSEIKDLADRLKERFHCEYRICSGIKEAGHASNIIAIGDVVTNPFIARLYWNWYSAVSAGFCGESGYVIQTIFDPLPVLPSGRVIVLGAADPEQIRNVIAEFEKMLPGADSLLKPVYNLYGTAKKPFNPSVFDRLSGTEDLYGFSMLVENFMTSGDERFLTAAMTVLTQKATQYKETPHSLTINWKEEQYAFKAIQYWDFICHLKHIDADTRLLVDKMFLEVPWVLKKVCSDYERFDKNYSVNWNHATVPMLGIYTISRYFDNRYGLRNDEFFEKAAFCFENTSHSYRPMEESAGYTIFAAEYNMYYYLMEGKNDFYASGKARRLADLMLIQVDNNGHFAGQGDIGDAYAKAANYKGLSLLDYYLKMGEFRYIADRVGANYFSVNAPFYPDVKPKDLSDYTGLRYVVLDKGLYEYTYHGSFEYETPSPPDFPRNMTFDKLQFRSSSKPDGEYLLLDGYGRGKHEHFDTGAIICYTAGGYKFLEDADYLYKKTSDHSIINVCVNGKAEGIIPSCAGLLTAYENADSAFVSILVPDYGGIDWTRNIYWAKERFFAVIDTVRAKKDADYFVDCTWKVLDRGMEEYDGQHLICKAPVKQHPILDPIKDTPPQTFRLKSTDDGGYWDHRVSSSNLPSHRIHQNKRMTMRKGDVYSFQNVFYIDRPHEDGPVPSYQPHKIDQRTMLIQTDNGLTLLMVDDAEHESISMKGKFLALSEDGITGAGVESICIGGKSVLSLSSPANIEFKDNTLCIDSQQAGWGIIDGVTFDLTKGVTRRPFTLPAIPANIIQRKSVIPEEKTKQPLLSESKAFTLQWQSPVTGLAYNSAHDMLVADIDNDGANEIYCAAGDTLKVYSDRGQQLWQYKDEAGIYSLASGDLDSDGKNELFVGTGDSKVITFNCDYQQIHVLDVPIESSGRFGTRTTDPHWVTAIHVRDIDKNNDMELILGMRTWQVQMYDNNYNRQWFFTYIYHGVKELAFADMDADGKEDIIAADHYGTVRILDWTSDDVARSVKTYTAIGDASFAWTDADDDGIMELINASTSGNMAMFKRPRQLTLREHDGWDAYWGYDQQWSFNNYGYGFNDIEMIHGKDNATLAAASETGYIYLINPVNGELISSQYLGSIVHTLCAFGNEYILAGTEQGTVCMLNADGRVLHSTNLGSRIFRILHLDNYSFVVMDTTGKLVKIATETQ